MISRLGIDTKSLVLWFFFLFWNEKKIVKFSRIFFLVHVVNWLSLVMICLLSRRLLGAIIDFCTKRPDENGRSMKIWEERNDDRARFPDLSWQ